MIDIANTLQKAQMLAQTGQFGEADRLFNTVVRAAPGLAQAWHLWGQMLLRAGNTEAAVLGLRKAVDLEAGNPAYLFSLAQALLKSGRADEAEKCMRKALRKAPDNASVHNELGTILKHLGRTDEARAEYLKSIKHQPDSVDAHYNLALLHYQSADYDDAIIAYQKALKLAPDAADIHSALGIALHAVERNDEALTHLDKALSANPGVVDWLLNRAAVLVALGRFEEALEDYRKVTAAQPANATAWKGIAMNKRFTDADDPDIRAIEDLLAGTGMKMDERIALAFGLGKALDDSKDYDRAFKAFEEANRLQRSQYDYSAAAEKQRFDAIKHCFTKDFFADRADFGLTKDGVVPVFILGMPRSGTSLVEQILASHPNVYGCGEILDLYQIISRQVPATTEPDFADRIRKLSASQAKGLAKKYLDRIVHLADGQRWISNKLPFNFLHVGWIRLLFPNARIIHCKRDARDVCLSIYQHGFMSMSAFAYDLTELGIYHRLYSDLMEHWNETLPGFMHEIQYEDMVRDQEPHTRALLEFCGLDWDPACLAFHESERSVRTASFSQVRKPIYNSSMERWRRYETHLGPLLEALERPF
ncbi:MAG: tetratricopeptide repeat protein [Gammaproteobacteria bacterium]|nr:tetratricopeptide repeat protein [Gammaproteobacteria bacterium]